MRVASQTRGQTFSYFTGLRHCGSGLGSGQQGAHCWQNPGTAARSDASIQGLIIFSMSLFFSSYLEVESKAILFSKIKKLSYLQKRRIMKWRVGSRSGVHSSTKEPSSSSRSFKGLWMTPKGNLLSIEKLAFKTNKTWPG